MTFEEAFERLNRYDVASVAEMMADWHPAILGQMLLAVQVAKGVRYLSWHPDYCGPLKACLEVEAGVTGKGLDGINTCTYKSRIKRTVEWLKEEIP